MYEIAISGTPGKILYPVVTDARLKGGLANKLRRNAGFFFDLDQIPSVER